MWSGTFALKTTLSSTCHILATLLNTIVDCVGLEDNYTGTNVDLSWPWVSSNKWQKNEAHRIKRQKAVWAEAESNPLFSTRQNASPAGCSSNSDSHLSCFIILQPVEAGELLQQQRKKHTDAVKQLLEQTDCSYQLHSSTESHIRLEFTCYFCKPMFPCAKCILLSLPRS